ncbi:hypothetical protein WR25_11606 [Diploscapter pachys]|uniref:HIT domain-containing protein n=1 Tax=Diploscapter pachys TaxID=2018661 RepID=A0A2A2KRB5_9BILA|nr:hypothetical protein WR25_11606 [Diploscapter pachys]
MNVVIFRDLRGSDVDFLEKLRDKSLKVIQDKYDVPANQLRAYFHYQPSFYHLHVHFVNIKYDAPGQLVYAAVSIEDVINNLRMASDYYQKATLTFTRKINDPLTQMFLEAKRDKGTR